jgi:hypothetical protein
LSKEAELDRLTLLRFRVFASCIPTRSQSSYQLDDVSNSRSLDATDDRFAMICSGKHDDGGQEGRNGCGHSTK